MKKRFVIMICAVLVSSALAMAGCGSGKQNAQKVQPQEPTAASTAAGSAIDSAAASSALPDSSGTSSETQKEEAVQVASVSPAAADAFSYADLTGQEFYFSSGAGGWATTMTINADGTFSGNYHDSDMGDVGEQYPHGTLYYCDFNGSFGALERVDDYTFRTQIDHIAFANKPETEEIKDDIKYVYATAYGLDDAADLYFYLPGKPVSDLPEPYISWVPMGPETEENGCLTIYGLYNEKAENGFSAYPAFEENTEDSASAGESQNWQQPDRNSLPAEEMQGQQDQIRQHVDEVQEQADKLEKKLEQEDLSQTEMNQVSADLYKLWDDELNDIWQYLKENMPEAEMQKLTEEERAWIGTKEAAIAEEGKQYAGGSIRPLAENRLGAQLTRERVYELLEYV